VGNTFGSLFAGIGGIDLGLERAGWDCRWQVEWDPFCQHVLGHHWPDVPRYGDITTVDWGTVERVDLLVGGFPCQPVSAAGKQKAQADDRWLWPQFARAIRELRPRLVLVENVRNLLSANGGSAFGDVLGGLAAGGYDAEWDCIPASAVGAPHQRDRLWLVAYPNEVGRDGGAGDIGTRWRVEPSHGSGEVAHATCEQGPQGHRGLHLYGEGSGEWLAGARGRAIESQWPTEPNVGRVAHGVPARVDRLRALGNAVVPQIPEWIGERLTR
jgi:DNA (cytosine-5)-methyltransferase 1